jgi:L-cysteine:1D-myo-inositol 2-amino-2-deoxy-alpha-D-glucopyranoside ligase
MTEEVVTALREALADDLDTPTALGVLDRWAADEALDGELVADAADALLGITLR